MCIPLIQGLQLPCGPRTQGSFCVALSAKMGLLEIEKNCKVTHSLDRNRRVGEYYKETISCNIQLHLANLSVFGLPVPAFHSPVSK